MRSVMDFEIQSPNVYYSAMDFLFGKTLIAMASVNDRIYKILYPYI